MKKPITDEQAKEHVRSMMRSLHTLAFSHTLPAPYLEKLAGGNESELMELIEDRENVIVKGHLLMADLIEIEMLREKVATGTLTSKEALTKSLKSVEKLTSEHMDGVKSLKELCEKIEKDVETKRKRLEH